MSGDYKTALSTKWQPKTEFGRLVDATPLRLLGRLAEKAFALDKLDDLYQKATLDVENEAFAGNVLELLNIQCHCPPEDLSRIPKQGPAIVFSNHPFGLADGLAVSALVSRVRNDFRILGNSLLTRVDALKGRLIPVNPFGSKLAVQENTTGVRRAVEWLRQGGLLIVFPAGEVSSVRIPAFRISDPRWSESISRLLRITKATAVPVSVHGRNSTAFYLAGLIHPRLRTALLPRELLNKRGRGISVSVGVPLKQHGLLGRCSRQTTAALRTSTELLRANTRVQPSQTGTKKYAGVVRESDRQQCRHEIAALPSLLSSGSFTVHLAESFQIPATLNEIGRLRELTFRAVGEGTGSARDLDRFDEWYRHLIVWNSTADELVGSYRLGFAHSILLKRGWGGLYSNTLFQMHPGFDRIARAGLELGRSFVREEYQRDFHPLLLLWKGVGQVITANPQFRYLFGPVSISGNYNRLSRSLIVEFCKARCNFRPGNALTPRNPFRSMVLPECDLGALARVLSIDELSAQIAGFEPDKKGLPVLMRHYLNLGGNVLDFNLDTSFNDALDGLIVVDLLDSDRKLLARYLGQEGLAAFEYFHGGSRAQSVTEHLASGIRSPKTHGGDSVAAKENTVFH